MIQYPQTSFASFITNVPTNPLVGSEFVPLVVANQYTEKVTLANLTAYMFLQSATAIASLPVASTPLAGTELVEVIQGGVAKVTTVNAMTAAVPIVVAALSLQNLSADLALQTLYTPPARGIYRLTVYVFDTANDAGASTATFTMVWMDDYGFRAVSPFTIDLALAGQFETLTQVMECVANQPIRHSFLGGGAYGTARYSCYLVLELLPS